MNIVNLTGIVISYRDHDAIKTIRPTGWRLLAERRFANTGQMIGEAHVAAREYEVPQIPPQADDTIYLVDPVVAEAMQAHDIHRPDVVVSHGASAEREGKHVVASRIFYLANP